MSRVAYGTVREKILDGIEYATKVYEGMTNGGRFEYAPEYLMTVDIANSIRGLEKWTLWTTPEWNVRKTLSEAKGMKQGSPERALRLNGRYDIVVWRKNHTPRFVVEVKHCVSGYSKLKDDVNRICTVFKNPKVTMQCGFIEFWSGSYKGREKDARIRLNRRIAKIFDLASAHANACGVKTPALISRQLCWNKDYASSAVLLQFNRAQ